jgi:hypothetical protein
VIEMSPKHSFFRLRLNYETNRSAFDVRSEGRPHAGGRVSEASDWFPRWGESLSVILTARRGDHPMRKVVASLFLSLDGTAGQSNAFVTVADDAMKEN